MRQFTETLRTLRMSLIDIAKVLKQAVTEIWVMGRVAGKPKVVAFQQQRRRPACANWSATLLFNLGKVKLINLLQAKFQHSS